MAAGDETPVEARLNTAPGEIVVVHCSESPVQAALDEFLAQRFPGQAAERISLPGGPWWLAAVAAATGSRLRRVLTGDLKGMREQVASLARGQGVRRVVLIADQDCTWYRRRKPGLGRGQLIREQGDGLLTAREEIARWTGEMGLPVEGHILTVDADGAVVFKAVF